MRSGIQNKQNQIQQAFSSLGIFSSVKKKQPTNPTRFNTSTNKESRDFILEEQRNFHLEQLKTSSEQMEENLDFIKNPAYILRDQHRFHLEQLTAS